MRRQAGPVKHTPSQSIQKPKLIAFAAFLKGMFTPGLTNDEKKERFEFLDGYLRQLNKLPESPDKKEAIQQVGELRDALSNGSCAKFTSDYEKVASKIKRYFLWFNVIAIERAAALPDVASLGSVRTFKEKFWKSLVQDAQGETGQQEQQAEKNLYANLVKVWREFPTDYQKKAFSCGPKIVEKVLGEWVLEDKKDAEAEKKLRLAKNLIRNYFLTDPSQTSDKVPPRAALEPKTLDVHLSEAPHYKLAGDEEEIFLRSAFHEILVLAQGSKNLEERRKAADQHVIQYMKERAEGVFERAKEVLKNEQKVPDSPALKQPEVTIKRQGKLKRIETVGNGSCYYGSLVTSLLAHLPKADGDKQKKFALEKFALVLGFLKTAADVNVDALAELRSLKVAYAAKPPAQKLELFLQNYMRTDSKAGLQALRNALRLYLNAKMSEALDDINSDLYDRFQKELSNEFELYKKEKSDYFKDKKTRVFADIPDVIALFDAAEKANNKPELKKVKDAYLVAMKKEEKFADSLVGELVVHHFFEGLGKNSLTSNYAVASEGQRLECSGKVVTLLHHKNHYEPLLSPEDLANANTFFKNPSTDADIFSGKDWKSVTNSGAISTAISVPVTEQIYKTCLEAVEQKPEDFLKTVNEVRIGLTPNVAPLVVANMTVKTDQLSFTSVYASDATREIIVEFAKLEASATTGQVTVKASRIAETDDELLEDYLAEVPIFIAMKKAEGLVDLESDVPFEVTLAHDEVDTTDGTGKALSSEQMNQILTALVGIGGFKVVSCQGVTVMRAAPAVPALAAAAGKPAALSGAPAAPAPAPASAPVPVPASVSASEQPAWTFRQKLVATAASVLAVFGGVATSRHLSAYERGSEQRDGGFDLGGNHDSGTPTADPIFTSACALDPLGCESTVNLGKHPSQVTSLRQDYTIDGRSLGAYTLEELYDGLVAIDPPVPPPAMLAAPKESVTIPSAVVSEPDLDTEEAIEVIDLDQDQDQAELLPVQSPSLVQDEEESMDPEFRVENLVLSLVKESTATSGLFSEQRQAESAEEAVIRRENSRS